MSPPLTGEVSPGSKTRPVGGGPVYKRCHLCVRIFSTKANLSSHIRHVHMGEAKHSRVKSIPCPHCNKMFSRKVRLVDSELNLLTELSFQGHMTEHVRTVHEGKKRIYKEVNCQVGSRKHLVVTLIFKTFFSALRKNISPEVGAQHPHILGPRGRHQRRGQAISGDRRVGESEENTGGISYRRNQFQGKMTQQGLQWFPQKLLKENFWRLCKKFCFKHLQLLLQEVL